MIIYTDEFLKHDELSHPENKNRLGYAIQFLEEKGVFDKIPMRDLKNVISDFWSL